MGINIIYTRNYVRYTSMSSSPMRSHDIRNQTQRPSKNTYVLMGRVRILSVTYTHARVLDLLNDLSEPGFGVERRC